MISSVAQLSLLRFAPVNNLLWLKCAALQILLVSVCLSGCVFIISAWSHLVFFSVSIQPVQTEQKNSVYCYRVLSTAGLLQHDDR